MNFNALVEAVAVRERPAAFNPLHGLIAVARFFRPSDGWMALAVLALNLLVVIWSVEEANWVPLPNLKWLLMMALAAGILLARLPWWGILTLPLGAALGLLTIVWQITSFQSREVAVTNAEQLWTRLALWWEAAETGSINIDSVPIRLRHYVRNLDGRFPGRLAILPLQELLGRVRAGRHGPAVEPHLSTP